MHSDSIITADGKFELSPDGTHLGKYLGTDECECIVPEGVIHIDRGAFSNPELVRDYDFSVSDVYHTELERVVLPEGLVSIGENAFHNCRNIVNIDLPQSLQSIGRGAFAYCSSLERMEIPEGISRLEENTFRGCKSLKEIMLPQSLQSIDRGAFAYCSSLERVEIPEGISRLEESTFRGCESLREIVLPQSLQSIGRCAFEYCSSLERLVIPESVSEIESETFVGCTSMRELILPKSITCVRLDAFCRHSYDDYDQPDRDSALRISHVLPESIGSLQTSCGYVCKFDPGNPFKYMEEEFLEDLPLLIPYFSLETLAHMIVNQYEYPYREVKAMRKGLNWPNFEIDSLAISEKITALLQDGDIDAPERAAAFHLNYVDTLDAQHLGAYIDAMRQCGYDEELACLNDSDEVQAKLTGKVLPPMHPMETSLAAHAKSAGVLLSEMRQLVNAWKRKGLTFEDFRYADGTPLSMEALAFIVLDAWHNDGSPQGREWVAAMDAQALQAAFVNIASKLVEHDNIYRKEIKLLKFCCVHGDEAVVWLLASNSDKFDHIKFNYIMLCSDTHAALVYADRNRPEDYAKRRHTKESELRRKLLDDFGFDTRGVRVFRAGADSIAATLLPDSQISLVNRGTGEALASFPRTCELNEIEIFDIWKDELTYVIGTRSIDLKNYFNHGIEWSLDLWKDENFSNPIYATLARRLVWQAKLSDGAHLCFHTDDGEHCFDAQRNELTLDESAMISIAHPVELTREELRAWQRAMAGVTQPIPQLMTPVRQPAPGTLKERYEGLMITPVKLRSTPEEHFSEFLCGGTKSVEGYICLWEPDDYDDDYDDDKEDDFYHMDYMNEYCVVTNDYEFYVDKAVETIENRRSYNADILLMDELLDPFQRAREAVEAGDMEKVRHMVEIELITPENVHEMLGIATEAKQVEVTAYLLNLIHEWQVEPEE